MFRSCHSLFSPALSPRSRPDLPLTLTSIPSSAGLLAIGAPALTRLWFARLLLCSKPEKLNPAFSHSSALLKNACFNNSFSFNDLRTLLQNTGGVLPQQNMLSRNPRPLKTNSFRIRTCEKRTRNPFRIRTYEKTGEAAPVIQTVAAAGTRSHSPQLSAEASL